MKSASAQQKKKGMPASMHIGLLAPEGGYKNSFPKFLTTCEGEESGDTARGTAATAEQQIALQVEQRSRRLDRLDRLGRFSASSLLFVGCICAFLGFGWATMLGVYEYKWEGPMPDCFPHKPCPSGLNYHPSTVSEMVSSYQSATGKLFYGFSTIASICLLMSRYPWELSNVFCGKPMMRCHLCSLAAVRTLLVPIGMLIVTWVPVKPQPGQSLPDQMASQVHTTGAVCFILGYIVVESRTLCYLYDAECFVSSPLQFRLRLLCVICSFAAAAGFVICGTMMGRTAVGGDEWTDTAVAFAATYPGLNFSSPIVLSELDLTIKAYGEVVVTNTASGPFLFFKQAKFWCEVWAGLLIVISHALIWYFCPERGLKVVPDPDEDLLVLGCKTEHPIVRIVKHRDLDMGRHLSAHSHHCGGTRNGESSWALVCGQVSDQRNDLWELQGVMVAGVEYTRIVKAHSLDASRHLTAHGRSSNRDDGSSWAMVCDNADQERHNDLWSFELVTKPPAQGGHVYRIRKAFDLDKGRCLTAHGRYSQRNDASSWALVHDHADPAVGNDLWKLEFVD